MSSKSYVLFAILLYFLGKGTSSEVVSVKRNVVDSFLVGENGCKNKPSVCTTRSATCQPDGWCLCRSSRPTFWKSATRKGFGYGYVDGCVSNDYIRAGVGKRFVEKILNNECMTFELNRINGMHEP